MSILGITRVVAIAMTLCLGLAGVSWSADDATSETSEAAAVETAPPADAAEADTEEAADAEEKAETDAAE